MALILAALAASARCTQGPPYNYCSCLESANHTASGRRDSAFGVSIVVPLRARKGFESADEFQAVHWTVAKSRISYYYYPLSGSGPVSFDHPADGQCMVHVNGRRVLVETSDHMGKRGLFANFEVPSAKHAGFGMGIFGPDRTSVCALGARTMWSALFGDNSLRALTILGISTDVKSFIYEDAFGVVTRAKVGDRLPDGSSIVRSISPQSVTVRAIEPDGNGGWKEVDREMDSVQAWTILAISPQASTFHYKNAFGDRTTARVGDRLPDGAVVRGISPSAVTVRRLEPDGAGGWKQVERIVQPFKESVNH